MALTEEQRQRKNEMAKLNRAKKKATKAPVVEYESENNEPIEDDVKDEVQEVEKVEVEDPEIARKKAIADKRRESLTLARSKIKPKSQITKEKDNEIAIMKAENEKLKAENAKVLAVKPQVTRQPVQPVRQRPIRREPRQEREREPSMDYLADQNYGEQLRERHKHNMYQRMMSDTFM
jgi:hypothetical protein